MAAQLLAFPALAKAIAFAKGITGLGGAVKGGAATLAALGKGQAARMATRKFAGDALAKAGTMMPKSIGEATKMLVGNDLYANKGQLVARLLPDAAVGAFTGATTEGDIFDKGTMALLSTVGGGFGGIGAGRLASKLPDSVGFLADMGGSIAGDMVGMKLADDIIRLKGGGTTPMEKKMMEQDALYRAQLEQDFRQKYGIGGTVDPMMASNGLVA